MKTNFAPLLLLTAGFIFTACESDLPPEPKGDGPLRRGLSGQGTIVPVAQPNDPMVDETGGPTTGLPTSGPASVAPAPSPAY